MRLGAVPRDDGTVELTVWAPRARTLDVYAADAMHPLERGEDGLFSGTFPGGEYLIAIDGAESYPDPCSRSQPYGVRGASAVVDPGAFTWTDDAWPGVALDDLVIYELHVGTFTDEGTFDAVIPKLDGLKEIGITAIELMPIGQFPGHRNWGYDGTYVYAAQNSYGGPAALKRLVDAAHQRGLAMVLDVRSEERRVGR